MICIYQIKNLHNNNIYIGSTKEFKKRKSRHLRDLKKGEHHSVYLQRSYNLYGLESFIFEILEECLEEELFEKEELWTKKLLPEYNVGSICGGDNYTNNPNKEEIKKKIMKGLEKAWENPTSLPKESNGNWKGGKTFFTCPVCNTEIRISGDKAKPKTCGKCRNRNAEQNPFFGRKHSEETKEKIRQTKLKNRGLT
jgi:group I intron endonuclease